MKSLLSLILLRSLKKKRGGEEKVEEDENRDETSIIGPSLRIYTFYCGTRVASGAWQHRRCLERCNRAITVPTSPPVPSPMPAPHSPPRSPFPAAACDDTDENCHYANRRDNYRERFTIAICNRLETVWEGRGGGEGDYSTNHLVTFNYRSCSLLPTPLNPANLPNPRKRRPSFFLPSILS